MSILLRSAGALVALVLLGACSDGSAPTPSTATPSRVVDDAAAAGTDPSTLVVHDGDLVRADGILSRSGPGVWQICPLLAAGGTVPTGPAPCPQRLALVTGLARDVPLDTEVRVRGRMRAGVISAVSLDRHRADASSFGYPTTPPCPAPRGGWSTPPAAAGDDSITALDEVVSTHRDVYGAVSLVHVRSVTVVLVGTTGDVGRARAQLAARFRGALCVYRVPYSTAQLDGAMSAVQRVSAPESISTAQGADAVYLELTRMTPRDAAALAPIRALLRVEARIRPV